MSKIKTWQKLSALLKTTKAAEMQLRKEICGDILIGLGFPCRKTTTFDGIEVKAENNVDHTIDDAALNQIFKELKDEERNAVKYKPSLVMAAYKKLPKDSLLHEVVTSKPTAPTLKVL